MDGGQVGVLEERDEVGWVQSQSWFEFRTNNNPTLAGFLKSHHSRRLETKVGLDNDEVVRKHIDETMRGAQTLKS